MQHAELSGPTVTSHARAIHRDIDIGAHGVRFALDFMGMAFHGDCHTHVDALCHISYKGLCYNGKPAEDHCTTMKLVRKK